MEHQVNDQVQQASLTSSNDIASKIDNVEKEKDKKNCSIPSCNDNDQSARPLNAEGSGNPTNAQPTTASTTTSDDDDEQRNIISLFHHLQHSGNMKLKLNNHHDITEQMNDPSNNHNNGNNNNNKAVRDDNNVVIAKTLANMSMKTIFHPDNLASPKGPFDRTIYSTNAIGVNDDDDDTTTINDDALMKSSSKPTLMSITTSLSRKSSSSPRVQLDSDNNDDEDEEDDDDDGPIDDEEDEVSDDEGNNDSNNGNGQPQDGGKLWSLEEDNILLQLQSKVGNRWSWIARKLPGRTENQIKTRFKSILRASKRMWTKAEDELLIAKQKQHRNDWVKIAQSFPKRTKNGVRVRFKQLLNIKLGAVEKSTPGSPRQALLSGYDSEIVDRKTWIKTSKLKNNNNNNNTNSNNISNKSRSHDSDELSSTHSLKKRKLSSHSFASSNHNGKDSSMSPSQNRLNDVLINKVIARTPSSSQDTCDDKRESSSETESIAASATTSCSKSTNASTASSASLNSASSQASYGLVSPFQMLFSGPVTTASPNTTSPKVPQNQNIFLPANITGFINPVALNQPTQILLPVPQSSIPTLAAASVNTVPSGQIPFFAFLPITGANIQGDGANKLMPNMFSQVPLVAFPLNMAPGVNRPSPQLSSAQETNKS